MDEHRYPISDVCRFESCRLRHRFNGDRILRGQKMSGIALLVIAILVASTLPVTLIINISYAGRTHTVSFRMATPSVSGLRCDSRRLDVSEASGASPWDASAPRYGIAEDIRVLPVVVAPLKLGDVERQILAANVVERADDAALDERPEAFNTSSMGAYVISLHTVRLHD